MIKKAEGSYNPADVEGRVSEYWTRNAIYSKQRSIRSEGQRIYFLDGPPYTTGNIHVGTALNKTLKDLRIRYWRMNGFNVRDQPGWDMHGLPIEVNVEKSFGLKSKRDIEKTGLDKFVTECKRFALNNLNNMTQQFMRLGVWMDWERPYMTISQSFTETVWLMLSKAREKGLLYEGERSTQWCYRCGTALAEAEIEYVDRKDPSIYVKMPMKSGEGSLLIWTTTPWTIPANMAVAVHPEMDYALVEFRESGKPPERLVVLEQNAETIGSLTNKEEYEVIRSMKGKELEGTEYTFPLEGFVNRGPASDWSWKVLTSGTVETGYTGLVHTAPGHGPEDFELGQKYGIAIYSPVDDDGRYTAEAGVALAGKRVVQMNETIVEELKNRGLLYHSETIEHRYGTCWRCNTPIIYRSTRQWYLKTSTFIRDRMLEEINRIVWVPEWAGSARQAEWARNLKDWCISRQRFWGTPMPVWRCSGCGNDRIISSILELANGKNYREGMDLHRPSVDAVTFDCEKCGREMRRIPDVLDVWVDSGVCSWASLDYPSGADEFDKWWPGKWIVEAGDQTRGWFNSQLITALIMFDKAPFQSAMLHGWVNDSKGRQMHKSLGNSIDPMDFIKQDGADALRFYMLGSRAPWDDLSFQPDGPKNARRTLNILWNVYNFASTYMALDDFTPSDVDWRKLWQSLKTEDRWILSRTQRLVAEVTEHLESLEIHRAVRSIESFIVEDLSHWYVRMVRDRTWTEEKDPEKESTYKVLHHALSTLMKIMAPFTPSISEEIYRAMNTDALSVHLTSWPSPLMDVQDEKLEMDMSSAREIVEAVFKARQETGMKLRWPLSRMIIKPREETDRRSIGRMLDIIEKQANVKASKLLQVGQEWDELVLTVVPNPNAIGKIYRQWSGKIAMMLKARPASEVIAGIKKGAYMLGIEGQTIRIQENMVSFSYTLPKNVAQIELKGYTLYVDFNMDRKLELESLSREVMRRIQKMRKDLGLQVEEPVYVQITATGSLLESILEWDSTITTECRIAAMEIVDDAKGELRDAWKIDQSDLAIALSRKPQERVAQTSQEGGKQSEKDEGEEKDAYVMEAGETYAVFEDSSDRAVTILETALENGVDGMCISREFPDKLRRKHKLENCKIVWLSSVGDENAVKPNDLEKIAMHLKEFFDETPGMALMDCIEYLVSNNGFLPVVRLIQQLRDMTAKTGSILLVSLDPSTLSESDLGVLQKEVDRVI
ncbi:MAG: isoleucine--tRNA ligase [Thermoplasmata archaeon]|nr:isoleucine--tRNA ligase [Candidatus Sysuiplasma acidicola]